MIQSLLVVLLFLSAGLVYIDGAWFTTKNLIVGPFLVLFFLNGLRGKLHVSILVFSIYWLIYSMWSWYGTGNIDTRAGLQWFARYSMAQACFLYLLSLFFVSRMTNRDYLLCGWSCWFIALCNSVYVLIQKYYLLSVPFGFLGEPSMGAALNGLMGAWGLYFLPGWWKVLFLINVAATVSCNSTTAVGVLGISVAMWIVLSFKPRIWLCVPVVLGALFAFGVFWDAGFLSPGDRFLVQEKFFVDYWNGWRMWRGTGNGSFFPLGLALSKKVVDPDGVWIWMHLHSGLLRLLFEGGLIGFSLALWPAIAAFFRARSFHPVVLGMWVPSLAFSVVQYPEFFPFHGLFIAAFLLWPLSQTRNKKAI